NGDGGRKCRGTHRAFLAWQQRLAKDDDDRRSLLGGNLVRDGGELIKNDDSRGRAARNAFPKLAKKPGHVHPPARQETPGIRRADLRDRRTLREDVRQQREVVARRDATPQIRVEHTGEESIAEPRESGSAVRQERKSADQFDLPSANDGEV